MEPLYVKKFPMKVLINMHVYGIVKEVLAEAAKREAMQKYPVVVSDEWFDNVKDCEFIPECQGITVLVHYPKER